MIETGDLENAFETYDMVAANWDARYAQEAFFNLGEIRLYQSNFDGAVSYYNVTLREYPDEPRANDAIDRLLLLKSMKRGEQYAPEIVDFAKASLLRRQGKSDEALGLFRRIAKAGDTGALTIESLRNVSEIHVQGGAFEDAVRTYKLVGETLDTYFSPSALEAVGDIYLSIGSADDAIRAYEDVILRFPGSVAAGEARRKIEVAKRQNEDES